MPTTEEVRAWRGRHVIGNDGQKIGTIDELYADDHTGEPAWALVHTGLFGRKPSFVPIAEAEPAGDDVRVPFDKAFVKHAPGIEPDGNLSAQEEDELFRYYGHPGGGHDAGPRRGDGDRQRDDADRGDDGGADPRHGDATREHDDPARRGTGDGATGSHDPVEVPGGLPGRARDVDDAMTLSAEQVHVGTRELPATKVRMRKVTITEHVDVTVPVTREEVRLEEVPIDAPDADDTLPAEGEVTLRQEVPVIETRTVDRERVRLEKDRVTDQVEVTEPARREEVELEGTSPEGRPRDGR